MCFVWIWEQTAIISLYSINWLVFITETQSVECAARTEYICFSLALGAQQQTDWTPVAIWHEHALAPSRTVSCDVSPLRQDPHCLFTSDGAADTVCSPLISLCGHLLLLQTEVRNTCLSRDFPYKFYNTGTARNRATRHFASTSRHFNTCLTSHPVPGFRSFREVPKKRAVSFVTSDCMSPGKSPVSSDGFSWSLVLGIFTKIYQENSGFMKFSHSRHVTCRDTYIPLGPWFRASWFNVNP